MAQQTFEFKEENHFLGFTDPSIDIKLNIGGFSKQMTALDWFFNQLPEKTQANNEKEYYQAKQMEKEQIVNAHLTGIIRPLENEATKEAEQYYNETYK